MPPFLFCVTGAELQHTHPHPPTWVPLRLFATLQGGPTFHSHRQQYPAHHERIQVSPACSSLHGLLGGKQWTCWAPLCGGFRNPDCRIYSVFIPLFHCNVALKHLKSGHYFKILIGYHINGAYSDNDIWPHSSLTVSVILQLLSTSLKWFYSWLALMCSKDVKIS